MGTCFTHQAFEQRVCVINQGHGPPVRDGRQGNLTQLRRIGVVKRTASQWKTLSKHKFLFEVFSRGEVKLGDKGVGLKRFRRNCSWFFSVFGQSYEVGAFLSIVDT